MPFKNTTANQIDSNKLVISFESDEEPESIEVDRIIGHAYNTVKMTQYYEMLNDETQTRIQKLSRSKIEVVFENVDSNLTNPTGYNNFGGDML